MAGNSIGESKSIRGTSMELNTQKMVGGEKPAFTGKCSPGDTKPPETKDMPVPMPK